MPGRAPNGVPDGISGRESRKISDRVSGGGRETARDRFSGRVPGGGAGEDPACDPRRGPGLRRAAAAALAGGLAPDLSVMVMIGWERLVNQRSWEMIFGYDYRDPFWQGVFAVDNSIPLWAGLALAAWAARRRSLAIFAAAGLVHVLCDLPLHHEDARAQLFPVSDWVWRAPLSYWDPARHAGIVAPLEALLAGLCAAALWRRFAGKGARIGLALLAALELSATGAVMARAWAPGPEAAPQTGPQSAPQAAASPDPAHRGGEKTWF